MGEHLTLKCGTLKAWKVESDKSKELMRRYFDLGASAGAMTQHDTPEQKQVILDLIDTVDCEKIFLDWDGKYVSKDEAKQYSGNLRTVINRKIERGNANADAPDPVR